MLSQELSNVDVANLIKRLALILKYISSCRPFFAASGGSLLADKSENAVLLHKIKTRITTWSNSKRSEERFGAAVVAKAIIDNGGLLHESEPWVRGLLGLLPVRISSF